MHILAQLRDLPGLGPKSEELLIEIGIRTPDELKQIGAVEAFIKLRQQSRSKPSLNFLYALVGAIEGEHWLRIAKTEKSRLLMELDGYEELEKLFREERIQN